MVLFVPAFAGTLLHMFAVLQPPVDKWDNEKPLVQEPLIEQLLNATTSLHREHLNKLTSK